MSERKRAAAAEGLALPPERKRAAATDGLALPPEGSRRRPTLAEVAERKRQRDQEEEAERTGKRLSTGSAQERRNKEQQAHEDRERRRKELDERKERMWEVSKKILEDRKIKQQAALEVRRAMGFVKAPIKRSKGRGGRWAHRRPGRPAAAGALGIMTPGTPSTTFSEESSVLGQEQEQGGVDWTYDSGEELDLDDSRSAGVGAAQGDGGTAGGTHG